MSINKAFLKWAGGKTQSIRMISDAVGYFDGRFIEPFVGSGVVFLNMPAVGYILGDYNKDLISVYQALRDNDSFISDLRNLFSEPFNDSEKFYNLRQRFNTIEDGYEKALIFVYLNRHCFNGLCRYNKSGGFNVPYGKYSDVHFPEKELIEFKKKLTDNCEILCQSFEHTMKLAKPRDVIYCDPPYVPLSSTASFTDYSVGGFTEDQQKLLAKLAEESCATTLISNHDTEFTRSIYSKATKTRTRKVSRFISAKAMSRKPVYELLAIYNKE
jgi:DNA adenine methylase